MLGLSFQVVDSEYPHLQEVPYFVQEAYRTYSQILHLPAKVRGSRVL